MRLDWVKPVTGYAYGTYLPGKLACGFNKRRERTVAPTIISTGLIESTKAAAEGSVLAWRPLQPPLERNSVSMSYPCTHRAWWLREYNACHKKKEKRE